MTGQLTPAGPPPSATLTHTGSDPPCLKAKLPLGPCSNNFARAPYGSVSSGQSPGFILAMVLFDEDRGVCGANRMGWRGLYTSNPSAPDRITLRAASEIPPLSNRPADSSAAEDCASSA